SFSHSIIQSFIHRARRQSRLIGVQLLHRFFTHLIHPGYSVISCAASLNRKAILRGQSVSHSIIQSSRTAAKPPDRSATPPPFLLRTSFNPIIQSFNHSISQSFNH
ncbi:MAG: hypothetical protein WBA17_12595, partial [Saprospiraceae bacterium]